MTTLKELAEKAIGPTWLEKYYNFCDYVNACGMLNHSMIHYIDNSFCDLKKETFSDEDVAKKIFEIIFSSDEERELKKELSVSVAKKLRLCSLWAEAYDGNLFKPRLNEIGVMIPFVNVNKDDLDYFCHSIDDLRFHNLNEDQICDLILKDQMKMIQDYYNDK